MKYILFIIAFALAQAFILNHILIFGVVTPLLYMYLAILFPRNYSHWARLLLSFTMGIVIDALSNTPGLSAASMTMAGFVQPYILELFLKKEDEQNFRPSISSMGFFKFLSYAFLVALVFCLTFFSLELFSPLYWLECIEGCFGSLFLTLLLIITIDSTRK